MKIRLSIPKPCDESWRAMKPELRGRFCDSCQHTVMDLSRASDGDLVRVFTGDGRPKCARFDPRQLERVLSNEPVSDPLMPAIAFGSLLALLAPEKVAAQDAPLPVVPSAVESPRPIEPIMLGEMTVRDIEPLIERSESTITGDTVVIEPIERIPATAIARDMQERPTCSAGEPAKVSYRIAQALEPQFIEGLVVDDHGETLIGAAIMITGSPAHGASTDLDGRFRLLVPDSLRGVDIALTVAYIGYETRSFIAAPIAGEPDTAAIAAPPLVAVPQDRRSISGYIKDPSSGWPVPDAVISIARTNLSARTDTNGFFSLRLPDDYAVREVHVVATAQTGEAAEVTVAVDKLPVSIPMDLPGGRWPAPTPSSFLNEMVLTLTERDEPLMTMGFIVTTRPSASDRIQQPLKRIGSWMSGVFQR